MLFIKVNNQKKKSRSSCTGDFFWVLQSTRRRLQVDFQNQPLKELCVIIYTKTLKNVLETAAENKEKKRIDIMSTMPKLYVVQISSEDVKLVALAWLSFTISTMCGHSTKYNASKCKAAHLETYSSPCDCNWISIFPICPLIMQIYLGALLAFSQTSWARKHSPLL